MSKEDDPTAAPSPVGYGRPPEAYKFKKGKSGNPRGRPQVRRADEVRTSIDEILMAEVFCEVEIKENGRVLKMPLLQAMVRSMGVNAVKGSLRSQLALTSMIEGLNARTEAQQTALLEAALEYKKRAEWAIEDAQYNRMPIPDPAPHPDEIQFDSARGKVIFNGPMDDIEAAKWENARENRDELAEEVEGFRKKLKRLKDPARREILERLIASTEDLIAEQDILYPDKKTRRQPDFHIHEWRERQIKFLELKRQRRDNDNQ